MLCRHLLLHLLHLHRQLKQLRVRLAHRGLRRPNDLRKVSHSCGDLHSPRVSRARREVEVVLHILLPDQVAPLEQRRVRGGTLGRAVALVEDVVESLEDLDRLLGHMLLAVVHHERRECRRHHRPQLGPGEKCWR